MWGTRWKVESAFSSSPFRREGLERCNLRAESAAKVGGGGGLGCLHLENEVEKGRTYPMIPWMLLKVPCGGHVSNTRRCNRERGEGVLGA